MCECTNYEMNHVLGDGRFFYCYKCNDCGREWFEVYQLNFIEECEGNLEDNEDWGY